MLRRIQLGSTEVCRGIYGAVRDADWNTILPEIEGLVVKQNANGFDIAFRAKCHCHAVRFVWNGSIRGEPDGTITYAFEGTAESAFMRNRIGLVVLHPIRECAGQPCVVEHTDGSTSEGMFPDAISPHQPFFDMQSIRHHVRSGVDAVVTMEGEVFEMEDQRNWTDASYKTYGTPLALPFPVPIEVGDRVHQRIIISLRSVSTIEAVSEPDKDPTVIVDWSQCRPWVPIGLQASPPDRLAKEEELETLRPLALDHLRIDVDATAGRSDAVERLHHGLSECRRLQIDALLAITISDSAHVELTNLLDAIKCTPAVPIRGWIIFHRDEKVSNDRWLRMAGNILDGTIIGGTNAYFTELNRNRPDSKIPPSRMHAYSMNPQVHAFDDFSVIETLQAQAETVRTARTFCRAPVLISPITLLPRFNPNATGNGPAALPQDDPRQTKPFCAAWTLGSLAALQRQEGLYRLTYHQTVGGAGVVNGNRLYPVGEVFVAVAGASKTAATTVSHPERIAALAIEDEGGERHLLLANLTDESQPVICEDLQTRSIVLEPYSFQKHPTMY